MLVVARKETLIKHAAERMSDTFEAITETMREVISGIYFPFVAGAQMLAKRTIVVFNNSIRENILHLRIVVV